MEFHMLNKLTEKFWRGECSEEEEQTLFAAVRESEPHKDLQELREYIQFLEQEKQETVLGEDFDTEILNQIRKKSVKSFVPASWMKIAAAIVFLISIGFGINQLMTPRPPAELAQITDTFEDRDLAFVEVQKALFLLSSNLNEGMEQTRLLGEFDKAKKELNNNKKDRTDESN